jgi:hypothetical protein
MDQKVANHLQNEFLKSFTASAVLASRKLHVGNTNGFEIGNIIEIEERLSFIEKVKRFLKIHKTPRYKIMGKDAQSLTISPSYLKPEKVVRDWAFFPPQKSDTVTFKRPSIYKDA